MRPLGFSNGIQFSTAIILLGIFSSCTGFQCYVCNSAFQKDCDDTPVPKKYLVTCTPANAHPMKHSMIESTISVLSDSGSGSGSSSGSKNNAGSGSASMAKINQMMRPIAPLDANFTHCRKQVFTVGKQSNGDTTKESVSRIARSCGYIERERASCKRTDKFGNLNLLCQCNSDACNEASGTKGPTFVLFLTFGLFAGILRSY